MLNQNIFNTSNLKVLSGLWNPLGIELSTFLYFVSQKKQWYKSIPQACENIVKETETQKEGTFDFFF